MDRYDNSPDDYVATCTQADDDGCSTDPSPALGACPACGYVFHDLPRHTDDAHGELCCGTPVCSADVELCVTHEHFPA